MAMSASCRDHIAGKLRMSLQQKPRYQILAEDSMTDMNGLASARLGV